MADRHDPQWVRYGAMQHTGLAQLPGPVEPTIGIGAYECTGCATPHVVIAAIYCDLETDVFLTPAMAREVAAQILLAADRVDPQGKQ